MGRLMVYDSKGNFIRKIGNIGTGPGEYPDLADFTIDKSNRNIYILSLGNRKINVYDFESNWIRHISVDNSESVVRHIQFFEDRLYTDTYANTEDSYLLQEIDKETGKTKNVYLPASVYNSGWKSQSYKSPFYEGINSCKYIQTYANTLMDIGEKITSSIKVETSGFVKEADLREMRVRNEEGWKAFISKRKVYNISEYAECDRYKLFKYYEGTLVGNIIINKETGRPTITHGLIDDLVYKRDCRIIMYTEWYASGEKGVYACVNSYRMPLLERIYEEDGFSERIDKELFANPEDLNPVIFYYE